MLNKFIALISLAFISLNITAKELSLNTTYEYLRVLHVEENQKETLDIMLAPILNSTLNTVANNMRKQGISQGKINAGINAVRPHVIIVKDKLVNNIDNIMPFDDVAKNIHHPILSESYSDEELKGIIKFLRTPLGKIYIRESIIVMKKSVQLNQKLYGPIISKYFAGEMNKQMELALDEITLAIKNAK